LLPLVFRSVRLSREWSFVAGVLLCLAAISSALGQSKPEDTFLNWMNSIAQRNLRARAETIRAIRTSVGAEQRKLFVRDQLLHEIGGLPNYHGPLNAKITGELHTDFYTIEKTVYESLPGFYVTANLYRPNRPGRYPAVLLQAGHTQEGKLENQRIAANLALKGFVVLSFDPISQGEREQTYSRQFGEALAGWSVPEHIELDAQSRLIGEGLARYFIWDAMRSLDYLASRPEVDASRIGAAGCSGGGALTTFIGALDARIKAVVSACFPSSYQTMFSGKGPHGEMTFPHFLADGLDTADFVELSAPTPWLLQSSEADQYGYSHEGVEHVYREAQHWYDLSESRDRVGFMVAPGPHGMPLESREALYRWMIRWLKKGDGDFHEQPVKMFSNFELCVTPTGHVDDLAGSRKLHEVLRQDLQEREDHGSIDELAVELKKLQIPGDTSAPSLKVLSTSKFESGSLDQLEIESEPGIWLDAALYLPSSSGRKSAVVVVSDGERFGRTPATKLAEKMAALNQIVLLLEPRRSHWKNTQPTATGDWYDDLHADLIGRNLPAMRAHDILRGVDLLSVRPDVDSRSIRAVARGVAGIWLLFAAAADSRLTTVWLDGTPQSLRSALDNSVTIDLADAVVPGFVLRWDLQNLVKAIEPRRVLWTDPTNWTQHVIAAGPQFSYRYVVGDVTDEEDRQDDAFISQFLK